LAIGTGLAVEKGLGRLRSESRLRRLGNKAGWTKGRIGRFGKSMSWDRILQ
jgi:hypothetical protein